MKGPFFLENRIRYEILWNSNFDDVDVAMNAIKLHYDVDIKEQIECFDSYWMVISVNKEYNACVRYHDPVGLVIYALDEQSNNMVTELANYLSKEVFNERENINHTP